MNLMVRMILLFCLINQSIFGQVKKSEDKKELMHKWFYKLSKKVASLPIYIFETDTLQKRESKIKLYKYAIIDPKDGYYYEESDSIFNSEKDILRKNCHKMLKGFYGADYDSLFVQPQLQKAQAYFAKNKITYDSFYLQVPIQLDEAETKIILEEKPIPGIFETPSLKETLKISEEEFVKMFKMSSEEYNLKSKVDTENHSAREKFKNVKLNENFNFKNDNTNLRELVISDKFSPDFSVSDIPKPLMEAINKRFQELKTYLPPEYFAKVKYAKLIVGDPEASFNARKLWLETDGKNVMISSLLIRAVIMDALSFSFVFVGPMKSKENPEGEQVKIVPVKSEEKIKGRKGVVVEVDATYEMLFADVSRAFDFAFFHEFAHIFLDDLINESRCDCFAVKFLKALDINKNYKDDDIFKNLISTGIFNSLLVVIKGDYWGDKLDKESWAILRDRSYKIDELSKNEVIDCR